MVSQSSKSCNKAVVSS